MRATIGSDSAPEKPATLPLVPDCIRACQELDRVGRDLAVTGCACPFLFFCHCGREMSLWHMVCGTGQGNDGGKVTGHPQPRIALVQWVEASLMRSLDTGKSPEL